MNSGPAIDPTTFKNATRAQWDKSAKGWSDSSTLIRDWLLKPTEVMLEMAQLSPDFRVLDVAAGAGDQTLDIARRVGAEGSVLATDLSPAILDFARENARRAGLHNVETTVADGEHLDVPEASFDAVICRLGLMFFPDPLKGLREMFGALKPGGRASVMVFSVPEANPCVSILMSTALRHAGLPMPNPDRPGGLLSLGRAGRIDELFERAGFSSIATVKMSAPFRLPAVGDYLAFIRSSASPVLQILDRLDSTAKAAAWAEIEQKLAAFTTDAGWEGPNELLVASGRR